MFLYLRLLLTAIVVNCFLSSVYPQAGQFKKKRFQFSVAPGLSTNGFQPGSYSNYVSINFTSGYSAENYLLEIGGISNLNTNGTKGLQFAVLANLTGANAFGGLTNKERDSKIKSGFNARLDGAQFSGLTNVVFDEIYGAQITGGINVGKNAMMGFQLAGISNIVYKFSFGVQLAGLSNVSVSSLDGVQLAGLMNYSRGEINGAQLSLFNSAGFTGGKIASEHNGKGMQLGVINYAEKMNGLQLGLINICDRSQGTQVGLINIYKGSKTEGTKDGTAIGLLNIGDIGYASVYSNELFAFNYEIATGNKRNGRLKSVANNKYVENAIIYSHHAFNGNSWGLGYGLKKMIFNRSVEPGKSESYFLSYGVDIQYVNSLVENVHKPGFLSRVNFIVGKRAAPKLFGVNIFGGLTYNFYRGDSEKAITPGLSNTIRSSGNQILMFWPGFKIGILLH